MKLIILRHGSTEFTKKISFFGSTNPPLSSEGIAEAKAVISGLKRFKPEMIFSSALIRARQTAEILAKELGCSVIENKSLNEVNFGIFEGLSREAAEKKFPNEYKARQEDKWNYRLSGGESYLDAYNRVFPAIEKISLSLSFAGIVVTHATVMKTLYKALSGISLKEAELIHWKPCSYFVIEDGSITEKSGAVISK